MAKSLRSKWRRKCRAVKRVRYGQKELERLKKTLGLEEAGKTADVAMQEISDIVTVTDVKQIKDAKAAGDEEENDIEMVIDGKKRMFNQKTMRDQNGSCPIWMHQRKIKKRKQKKNKRKVKH